MLYHILTIRSLSDSIGTDMNIVLLFETEYQFLYLEQNKHNPALSRCSKIGVQEVKGQPGD